MGLMCCGDGMLRHGECLARCGTVSKEGKDAYMNLIWVYDMGERP